jgi:hypothetical protein
MSLKTKEKAHLTHLPIKRYELLDIQKRTVNAYAHISYKYNFYSVPREYIGQELTIKSNGSLIKIYDHHLREVALHQLCLSQGEFVTNTAHNPKLKNFLSRPYEYEQKMNEIGEDAKDFFSSIKNLKPNSYTRTISGILHLRDKYTNEIINQSLKRASLYGVYNYLSIKKIIEDGLYKNSDCFTSILAGGFANDLSIYDKLTGGSK